MDTHALATRLSAMLDEFPAQSSLLAVDLTGGEVIASIRADVGVTSASTIKLAILLCALTEVEAGRL